MLKKPIKFKNLDGEDVEEVFYFHFSKAELITMELSAQGGLQAKLERLVEAKENGEIIDLFTSIITGSIGRRSANGVTFEKNPQIISDFVNSDAYSELFMELFSDDNAGAAFINGLMPQDLQDQVAAEVASKKPEDVQLPAEDEGAKLLALGRDLTSQEFGKLSPAQQGQAYQAKIARDAAN